MDAALQHVIIRAVRSIPGLGEVRPRLHLKPGVVAVPAEAGGEHPRAGVQLRPPKHGGEFIISDPATWGNEQAVTATDTPLYGKATAQAWDRLHPRLTRRAAWLDHDGPLPIIEGTIIRLVVEKLPSGAVNKPVWVWWSGIGATKADVNRFWQSFLRRFDIEHRFRLGGAGRR